VHVSIPDRLSPAEGRKFGVSVGLAFLALTALLWWRGTTWAWLIFGGVGAALVLAGLLLPGRLGPVYRGWMRFALLLSKVTTPIFMGIVYFGLFLVTGVLRRRFGGNPMVHADREGSYWFARERTRGNLERQF
jgi:hypothetical protein